VCALSVAQSRVWQSVLRGATHTLVRPPQALLADSHNGLQRLFGRLREMWRATDEVGRLRDENRALLEALARLDAEAHDSSVRLRSFAAFDEFRQTLPGQPLRVVPAQVMGADASAWRHSLIVNRGSAHGLRVGVPAVWGGSIIGLVTAVRPTAATVRLLTDGRAGLKVRVARTGDVGVLRGGSSRDALLHLKWLHLHPVAPGDLIVTAGLDPAIPPGLVAGSVVQSSKAREHLFYDVRVRPLIDLDRVTELLLILYTSGDAETLLQEEAK